MQQFPDVMTDALNTETAACRRLHDAGLAVKVTRIYNAFDPFACTWNQLTPGPNYMASSAPLYTPFSQPVIFINPIRIFVDKTSLY